MAEEMGLVAYCGLYCDDCFHHKEKIADLARDLRKELRQEKFDRTAKFMSTVSFFKTLENYRQFYEVPGTMVNSA